MAKQPPQQPPERRTTTTSNVIPRPGATPPTAPADSGADDTWVELDRTYLYNGKHYGPGKVQIEDEEVRAAVLDKQQKLQDSAEEPQTQAQKEEAMREQFAAPDDSLEGGNPNAPSAGRRGGGGNPPVTDDTSGADTTQHGRTTAPPNMQGSGKSEEELKDKSKDTK